MSSNLKKYIITFLLDDLELNKSSIELGVKLSKKNNIPLPITLWSHGILSLEELDKLYSFLFQKMK